MRKKQYYITTTLPYINAKPHIGFALEIVQADVIARFHRLLGEEVVFNFGTDEHGQKIYRKALQEDKNPKLYCDEYAAKFNNLKSALNLSYTHFIRTTDQHHIKAAQALWKICVENGYIKKGIYQTKYCIGCELEKQDSDLADGRCLLHPNDKIETIKEENYFFLFSKFQKRLLHFYRDNPDFVIPKNRLLEIINFVKEGLKDFSVSRLKTKMPWGIPVPDDPQQVMYVWFDALTNYISTLGWPENQDTFRAFWGTQTHPNAIQVAGKDNLRQQSAMWQAMLLAAGLPPTKQIFIHGFILADGGVKMSKSLGNVIDPFEYSDKYGTDALRYFLLAKINPFEDSEFTESKFKTTYNADLANGLGNLVARVAKLCEKAGIGGLIQKRNFDHDFGILLDDFRPDLVMELIWKNIRFLDREINESQPWTVNDNKKLAKIITGPAQTILNLAFMLEPFLPQTAEKIQKQYSAKLIKPQDPLFPRLN